MKTLIQENVHRHASNFRTYILGIAVQILTVSPDITKITLFISKWIFGVRVDFAKQNPNFKVDVAYLFEIFAIVLMNISKK